MERAPPLLLLGVATRGAFGLPAVRAGRVTGLLAGYRLAPRLPSSALCLPEPLEFRALGEVRTWLIAREARLAAALRAIADGREPGLELREEAPRHATSLRARGPVLAMREHGLRPARRDLMARRLEAPPGSELPMALVPGGGGEVDDWSPGVPEGAVQRLHAALESEGRKLLGMKLGLQAVGAPGAGALQEG
ncbi:MAG TPA: hypothetical protein VIL69_12735 [Roseomonas sp.]|jgi:hypothetical protein